jgi:hypothetical protein
MAAQINIINDVGTILKIPTKVSNELTEKACLCIGNAISEAKHSGETQVAVSIGIGTLSVNLIDMQCKFIPSKNLKTAIKDALATEENPLEVALEKAFAEKLIALCSEVL